MPSDLESITVRIPAATVDRARKIAEARTTVDQRVTTSDVIRLALTAGLPIIEEQQ